MARENPFRPVYRPLKENEEIHIKALKEQAFKLLQLFPFGGDNSVVAEQKLAEAVMWAVKDLTK